MTDEAALKIEQIIETGTKLIEEIRNLNNEEIGILLKSIKYQKKKDKKDEREFYLKERKRKKIYLNLLSALDLCDKNLCRKEKENDN